MRQYNGELEVQAEAIELVDRRDASAAVTDEVMKNNSSSV